MKLNNIATSVRKWSRTIHRDLSFFFSGMILIYAISGFVMNHRNSINPNYSIEVKNFVVEQYLPAKEAIKKEHVLQILETIDEERNYTKHYFPEENKMKVFLKSGSNLWIDLTNKQAVYEKLTRRPILSVLTKLHYNPGRWWTTFSDIFAVSLILITVTGIIMNKGSKGLWGRGGIELILGIIVPLLFIFL